MTNKILPRITWELNAKTRNLKCVILEGCNNIAEIQGTTKELKNGGTSLIQIT